MLNSQLMVPFAPDKSPPVSAITYLEESCCENSRVDDGHGQEDVPEYYHGGTHSREQELVVNYVWSLNHILEMRPLDDNGMESTSEYLQTPEMMAVGR